MQTSIAVDVHYRPGIGASRLDQSVLHHLHARLVVGIQHLLDSANVGGFIPNVTIAEALNGECKSYEIVARISLEPSIASVDFARQCADKVCAIVRDNLTGHSNQVTIPEPHTIAVYDPHDLEEQFGQSTPFH